MLAQARCTGAGTYVDLRVFLGRNYAAGTALNFLTGFALFGGSFLFSLYAGSVLRYSALDIGKIFLAAGTISVVMMPLIGRLGPKLDGRILLAIGLAVVAYSQFTASELTAAAGYWDAVRPNFLRSLGLRREEAHVEENMADHSSTPPKISGPTLPVTRSQPSSERIWPSAATPTKAPKCRASR